ncbi:hypothetical protein OBBRIDRAFT_731344, partial [Obba rivulosa]
ALVIYDHFTTLSREVDLIWGRNWTCTTILFHSNRWTIFIWALLQPIGFLPLATLPQHSILNNIAVFSAVRIYAVSGGSWWLASAVCLLNVVPVGTNSVRSTKLEISLPIILTLSETAASVTTATRACVIAADVLILLVIWLKTYATLISARRHNIRTPIVTVLLRDGW